MTLTQAQAAPPRVSVVMITYHHVGFIARAIESVLAQQTGFPIELVIGEDCSTDGTRQIVERYARAHPQIIRPVLQDSNVGVGANLEAVFAAARGPYLAFLEGDDYWDHPDKLSRQVALMDRDPAVSLCFHPVRCVSDDNSFHGAFYPAIQYWKPVWRLEELFENNFISTCSVVVRRSAVPVFPKRFKKVVMRDWPTFIYAGQAGKIACIQEPMACYRMHQGGVWTSLNRLKQVQAELVMWRAMKALIDRPHRRLLRRRFAACQAAKMQQLITTGRGTRAATLAAWLWCCARARAWDDKTTIQSMVTAALAPPQAPEALKPPTMLDPRELQYLHGLASRVGGRARVVELGCLLGGSTAALASGMQDRAETLPPLLSYDRFELPTQLPPGMTRSYRELGLEPGQRFRARFDAHNRFGPERVCVREYRIPQDAGAAQRHTVYPEQEPIGLLVVDLDDNWAVHRAVLEVFGPHLIEGATLVQRDFFNPHKPWIPLHMWQLRELLEPSDVLYGTPSLGLRCRGPLGPRLDTLWRPQDLADRAARRAAWDQVQAYWAGRIGPGAAGFVAGHAAAHALQAGDPDDAAGWGRRYEYWARSAEGRDLYLDPSWLDLMAQAPRERARPGERSAALTELAAEVRARGPYQTYRASADYHREPHRRRAVWRGVARRLAQAGHRRVALFGAGAHTRWLLSQTDLLPEVEVVCVIDDAPGEDEIQGVPVRTPARTTPRLDGVTALLPSSDTSESRLLARARECFGAIQGLDIVEVYAHDVSDAPQKTLDRPPPALGGQENRPDAVLPEALAERQRLGLPARRPWREAAVRCLAKPPWATGPVSPAEGAFLWDLIEAARPSVVVEIGTAAGGTAAVLAGALERFCDADAKVHSFDRDALCHFDPQRPVGWTIAQAWPELKHRVRLFPLVDAVGAALYFAQDQVDLALIKGDRSHPRPARDLLALLPVLRPGAWVVLHGLTPQEQQTEPQTGQRDDGTGTGKLFDAWPFEKLRPSDELPQAPNIGAVRIPDTVDRDQAAGVLLELLRDQPYATSSPQLRDAAKTPDPRKTPHVGHPLIPPRAR